MNKLMDRLRSRLDQRRKLDLFRELPANNTPDRIDFSSNDYLSIAGSGNPGLSGSTGSRLLTGNYPEIEEFETLLAQYHKAEAALVLGSGYLANLGLLSCMDKLADGFILDELCHASLRDGARLSGLPVHTFLHNDPQDLHRLLDQNRSACFLVVIESVYSMDGDEGALEQILDLCTQFGAGLIVDEAHSVGLYGNGGEGMCVDLGLQDRIWARVLTFGKAMGCHGAAILCTRELKDYLVNFARPFIYTTAPPKSLINELKRTYDNMSEQRHKVQQIRTLTNSFDKLLEGVSGFSGSGSGSAIRSLVLGDPGRTRAAAGTLQNLGWDVRPIVPPTVPRGKSRLRISFHAHNSQDQVTALCHNLLAWLKENPAPKNGTKA